MEVLVFQDETDGSRSEGEYLFRAGGVPPERDPMLALVMQMQQSPFLYMGQGQGGEGTSLGQFDIPDRQVCFHDDICFPMSRTHLTSCFVSGSCCVLCICRLCRFPL